VTSTSQTPAEEAVGCERAGRLIECLGPGGLPGAVALVLRRHLAHCPPCRELYRERIELAAQVGRVLPREVAERPAPGLEGRARSTRLRLLGLLLVASVLYLFATRLDRQFEFEPQVTLQWLEGTCWAGGVAVDRDHPRLPVLRSDWIRVEQGGRAQLSCGDLDLELQAGASLLVVSAQDRRLRLEDGPVTLRGSGRLETPRGIVELQEGQASVELRGGELQAQLASGAGFLVDAAGRRPLGP
jgi:hypothetical protein